MSTFTVQNDPVFELTNSQLWITLCPQKPFPQSLARLYWMRGDRHLPAYLLPRICTLLRNYEPLDLLESQAGRVAFKIPDPKQTSEEEFKAISNLIKDVGVALESIANTLADGIVEEDELKTTIPKLEAVIQECASLKYWLENWSKKRKKGSR
jgi:hypothetical protein